jgi:hypothetical protein
VPDHEADIGLSRNAATLCVPRRRQQQDPPTG